MIRRRVFIAGLASFTASWAFAQRRARIAVLDWTAGPDPDRLEPFRQGLRDEGLIEGKDFAIDYRSANGDTQLARTLAEQFAAGDHDVLVGMTTPAAMALRQAERTRPIVFSAGDPVRSGLVANLARPEANLTGVSNIVADLEGKRLGFLREIFPALQRVAYLASLRDPAAVGFVQEAQTAAQRAGLGLMPIFVNSPEEIPARLAEAKAGGIEAVIVQPIFTLGPVPAERVAGTLRSLGIPAIGAFPVFARAGGLMAYGPQQDFGIRRAGRLVARILRGARPADLPVEQPTEFHLVLNLATARVMGITIPQLVLARADEVLE